jgi:hypothetical protein
MNLKTIAAAASVFALLPATSFASLFLVIQSGDSIGIDGLSGSVVASSGIDNTTDTILLGQQNAKDWNMNVRNTVPPGPAATDAVVDYNFQVTQNAFINVSSTQNPFDQLTGLTLDLLVNGVSIDSATYTSGIYAEVASSPVAVTSSDLITVRSSWTSFPGPYSEVDVDFVITATDAGPTAIPLPASALLLVGALGGLGLVARKRNAS